MNKRDDRLLVEVDSDKTKVLCEWKRLCLSKYGYGGIKIRIQELKEGREEKEDLNNKNSIKDNKKEELKMAKRGRCPKGTRRSKSGKTCRRTTRTVRTKYGGSVKRRKSRRK